MSRLFLKIVAFYCVVKTWSSPAIRQRDVPRASRRSRFAGVRVQGLLLCHCRQSKKSACVERAAGGVVARKAKLRANGRLINFAPLGARRTIPF